jgi:L-ascorbate metabolism protein UlaG (beta-lactamase superfamily)
MNPSDELLQQMENAQPPFDDVDLVAATHHHRDHFTAVCVAKHLLSNPKARFVSTTDAVDLLKSECSLFFDKIEDRIHGLKPEKTKSQQLLVNGIGIKAFGSSHSPPHIANNLVMVFDVNSCTILHTGDTSAPNRDEYAAMELPAIDLGIIHKGFFLWSGGRGMSIISDIIKPDQIVLGHVYKDEVEKLEKRLPDYRKIFPHIHLMVTQMETMKLNLLRDVRQ